jgi:hypothetical protein
LDSRTTSVRDQFVTGAKQVDVAGKEEKRAWTLVVAISADGHALSFQIIAKGATKQSIASDSAPSMDEAKKLGF